MHDNVIMHEHTPERIDELRKSIPLLFDLMNDDDQMMEHFGLCERVPLYKMRKVDLGERPWGVTEHPGNAYNELFKRAAKAESHAVVFCPQVERYTLEAGIFWRGADNILINWDLIDYCLDRNLDPVSGLFGAIRERLRRYGLEQVHVIGGERWQLHPDDRQMFAEWLTDGTFCY